MEALYDKLSRQAFGLAYRMLGDGAAAEDVVQEAFLSVWRGADRIDTARGKLQSLVLTVVHNKAIDLLRSRKGGTKDLPLEPAVDHAAEGDFTERVAATIDGQVVRDALDTLPNDQRQALELAYYGGFTHTEISERLGLPLGTVKGRLRLALEKMRTALGVGRAA
jgi:RNA polymerase sigma-70 factor (ECF subfamily)